MDFISLVDKVINLVKNKKPVYKHLKDVKLKKLWKKYGRGAGVNVVVLDTGDHAKLVIEVLRRVAPECNVIFYDWKVGRLAFIIQKLNEIYNNLEKQPVHIINMSFSTGDTEDLKKIIQKLFNKGVLLVASSGNDPKNSHYPAKYTEYVLSVGSIAAKSGKISSFTASPYEALAPGEQIKGLPEIGTSFAAPHCSGIGACMWFKVPFSLLEQTIIAWQDRDD